MSGLRWKADVEIGVVNFVLGAILTGSAGWKLLRKPQLTLQLSGGNRWPKDAIPALANPRIARPAFSRNWPRVARARWTSASYALICLRRVRGSTASATGNTRRVCGRDGLHENRRAGRDRIPNRGRSHPPSYDRQGGARMSKWSFPQLLQARSQRTPRMDRCWRSRDGAGLRIARRPRWIQACPLPRSSFIQSHCPARPCRPNSKGRTNAPCFRDRQDFAKRFRSGREMCAQAGGRFRPVGQLGLGGSSCLPLLVA